MQMKILQFLFAMIVFFALFCNVISAPEGQPFGMVWSSSPIMAGNATIFSVTAYGIRETDEIQNFDLVDIFAKVCVAGDCVQKTDQILYNKTAKLASFDLFVYIPSETVVGIQCTNEFTCYYVYAFPENGTVQFGFKRFDKNFYTVYESPFKVSMPENATNTTMNVTGNVSAPFSVQQFSIFGSPFTMNYFELIGAVLFIIGITLVVFRKKIGIFFLIFGVALFILGLVIH